MGDGGVGAAGASWEGVASFLQGHRQRPTTIHTHSHTYGPFTSSSSPHLLVVGLGEEAEEPTEHRKNMLTPHWKAHRPVIPQSKTNKQTKTIWKTRVPLNSHVTLWLICITLILFFVQNTEELGCVRQSMMSWKRRKVLKVSWKTPSLHERINLKPNNSIGHQFMKSGRSRSKENKQRNDGRSSQGQTFKTLLKKASVYLNSWEVDSR